MPLTAVFDGWFHAPARSGDIAFLSLIKLRWDEYRKYADQETKNKDQGHEAVYYGLGAMVYWHEPRPSPCLRRYRRRHLLDDNPCSG